MEEKEKQNNSKWIFTFRQVLSATASSSLGLSGGMTFGITTFLLPQLHEDETFPHDTSYDSWIASTAPLCMVFGCICTGSFIDKVGRKLGHIILAFIFLLGWLVIAISPSVYFIILGRAITGFCTGAFRTVSLVYLGEISNPGYRPLALFTASLTVNLGTLLSHVLGKYMYWKTAAWVCGLPNLLTVILMFYTKESPLWLISKGLLDEGVNNFKWFRGNEEGATKEMTEAIQKQKEKALESNRSIDYSILTSSVFIKPYIIISFVFISVQFSGVNTTSFYAVDILENTFSDGVNTFHLVIVLDCIRSFVAIFICAFGSRLPRKILFLICNFGTCLFLFALVGCLKFSSLELSRLLTFSMILYITLSSAMVSTAWSFVGEVFPGEIRGLGSGLAAGTSLALLFVIVQITPIIIASHGIATLYAACALVMLLTSVVLCFILPETNGRSLQDIENSFTNNNKVSTTHL